MVSISEDTFNDSDKYQLTQNVYSIGITIMYYYNIVSSNNNQKISIFITVCELLMDKRKLSKSNCYLRKSQ